jgi:hypothetical protein
MPYTLNAAVVGNPITAAGYNQGVTLETSAPICRLTKSAAQSTSGTVNTNSAIAFDVETYDPSNMHDNATNNSRITVPTGWGGYYTAKAHARFTTTSAACILQFAVNGTVRSETTNQGTGTATGSTFVPIADDFLLNDGDYMEVFMQSNTASIALSTGFCTFSLVWVHI